MTKREKAQALLIESRKFREKLVTNMQKLDSVNINCSNCTGVCCTVARNSMMVTPVEALDLYFYLEEHIKDKAELDRRIEDSIIQYGLDREIYVKNKLMRKNYSCPLFKFESWGCPVEASLKPLGCLGYNALGEKVLDGENCASDVKLLEEVEADIRADWNELNQKLAKELKLDFEKVSIPVALKKLKRLLTEP